MADTMWATDCPTWAAPPSTDETLRTLNGARAIIREACAALEMRQRAAALDAEVERLRRERDALRLACQMLITDGTDLARLVERARSVFGAFDGGRGAEVDPALLAWARCVVAARGAIGGAER